MDKHSTMKIIKIATLRMAPLISQNQALSTLLDFDLVFVIRHVLSITPFLVTERVIAKLHLIKEKHSTGIVSFNSVTFP